MPWIVRDGEVLASAEVATTSSARRRGLLGRDSFEGALVLRPCRQVHTFGMRFAIDVVWCDADGRVLRIRSLPPWRVSRPVIRSRFVVETAAAATRRWGLEVGDVVEVIGDSESA